MKKLWNNFQRSFEYWTCSYKVGRNLNPGILNIQALKTLIEKSTSIQNISLSLSNDEQQKLEEL